MENKFNYLDLANTNNEPAIIIRLGQCEKVFQGLFIEALKRRGRAPETFVWLPEYASVVSFLENSKGKGIFLAGQPGTGKTIITAFILPTILKTVAPEVDFCYINCWELSFENLNETISRVKKAKIVIIDDMGAEEVVFKDYKKFNIVPFIVDMVERRNKMLIATSNQTLANLTEKYGQPIIDRISGICRIVNIRSNSQRNKM